ncbi:MAG: NAD(+)/NADH kinase [Clostridia bacterium]|nr:NAD(+)/NADH kinase [Clostridia bacterium]
MTFGIYYIELADETLNKVQQFLNENGCESIILDKNNPTDAEKCDFIISIGGDGTMLRAAKIASNYNKSVIGINCGHFGYLAELEVNEIELIKKIIDNDYSVEQRKMMKVTLEKSGLKFTALNDTVIQRSNNSSIAEIIVSSKEKPFLKVKADGIIIATPTGSTAYSMSAGGPIVDPSVDGIIVNSICAHSLFDRPVILNGNSEIKIQAKTRNDEDTIYLTVDGDKTVKLDNDDTVIISIDRENTADFIKIKDDSFYSILRSKMI